MPQLIHRGAARFRRVGPRPFDPACLPWLLRISGRLRGATLLGYRLRDLPATWADRHPTAHTASADVVRCSGNVARKTLATTSTTSLPGRRPHTRPRRHRDHPRRESMALARRQVRGVGRTAYTRESEDRPGEAGRGRRFVADHDHRRLTADGWHALLVVLPDQPPSPLGFLSVSVPTNLAARNAGNPCQT